VHLGGTGHRAEHVDHPGVQAFDARLGAQRLRRGHDAEQVERAGRHGGPAVRQVGGWTRGGVGPVQLFGLRGGSPGGVQRPRLGEQVVPGVLEPVFEEEAAGPFGDQGAMPRPLPLCRSTRCRFTRCGLPPCGVERDGGGPEVAHRPRPLGLDQPQQVQEVVRRVGGAGAEPLRHVVEFGQQPGALVLARRPDLPGDGEPAQQVGHGRRVEAERRRQQRHRGLGVLGQASRITEQGRCDRPGEMRDENGNRVVGEPVDGDGIGAIPPQHVGQPPVAAEPLADLLTAGSPHERQRGLHLDDERVERRCAVQQVRHGRVEGVPGVGEVVAGNEPFHGPLTCLDTVLDRLARPREAGEHVARLRRAGLVPPRLAQREDSLHRAVPGGGVAAQRDGVEGRDARRADQSRAGAVPQPDPHRLEAQPAEHRVVAVIRGRQQRVEHAGGGEQRRVGDRRTAHVVGLGVQPPVEVVELAVELDREPVGRRHGEAQLAQRLDAEGRGLRETLPVGQASHLHRRRERAFGSGGP
jgi:hypothetical protein